MKKEKLEEYIKNNYKNIIFIAFLVLVNIMSLLKFNSKVINNIPKSYSYAIYILFTVFQIFLYVIAINNYRKNVVIEKIFLKLVIPIGLAYMILIPVGRVPDERNHFLRAYEISQGHLISDKNDEGLGGRELTTDIDKLFRYKENYIKYSDVLDNIKELKTNTTSFLVFANTSLYSFISYLPQATGILISRILHLPIIFSMYMGRLFNFIIWGLLMHFSIKKIPYKKFTIFIFCFMPMMFQEAISLSADALTNGIAFFLISYVLYLRDNDKKLIKKDYLILSISSIVMSMCKIVYLPICLILFLIPYTKFKSKKDKYMKISILAIFVILINLIWLKISSTYLVEFREGVNSSEQLKFILSNPLSYIKILFNNYNSFQLYLYNIIGQSLCHFDVNLSYIYVFIYLVIILFTLITDNSEKIDKKIKYGMIVIILSIILLIFTSLYIQWTKVAEEYIDGVQGRYFIPLLIPISVLINNKFIKLDKNYKNYKLIIYELIIFVNIYSLMVIWYNHI